MVCCDTSETGVNLLINRRLFIHWLKHKAPPDTHVFCPGYSSEYYVNGVQVSLANYKKDLESIGVVTKARNCLVFQVCRNRIFPKVIDLAATSVC